ncbi:Adapter protein MecA [Eubacterium plexicaudatum ASF492]|uniref:Uncharacterized protein n=1 Tax=Eubacterium plexicaudatum ASF492 TaxID=1235802 RepID=N2AF32_9FIRM|nr:Adapter protein MecA [Eubacterium plexicaudatum ASF492]
MEFSVLDKQTLQCVMSEAEIADYGMDKHAIYQNDARAADFFRRIMKKAQQETGWTRKGNSIAVHAAFLSDESLEITFSLGPDGAEWICQQKDSQSEQTAAQMETAILKAKNLMHVIAFCSKAPAGLRSSLYEYHGVYFLLADVRDYGVRDTAKLFHLADEYMDAICYTNSIVAFIREHGKCVVKDSAVEILGAI